MKPIPLLVLAAVVGWLLYQTWQPTLHDPQAVSRPVTARGDLAGDEQNTIDIFRSAAPSVVYITSIAVRRNLFSLNVYEIPQGTGSGFIWDRQGRIVTNFHVISDASRLEVTLADHSSWKASLVGAAPDRDLAVLQITAPASKLQPIAVGESNNLLVGQKVFAIGNPFGLDQTLTTGVVSALGREITAVTGRTIHDVIQTDAAINPGTSGGALVDTEGRLLGINTAIYSRTAGGGSLGIGFAIPTSSARSVMEQILKNGTVVRGYIGVEPQDVTPELAQAFRLPRKDGAIIAGVMRGGPAERAGVRTGDILVEVEGRAIPNTATMLNVIAQLPPGESAKFTFVRDGRELALSITVGRRPKPGQ